MRTLNTARPDSKAAAQVAARAEGTRSLALFLRPAFLAAVIALPMAGGLALPRSAWAAEDIDQTLEMPADGLLSVENVAGRIEFVAWDRPEVQVRGEPGKSVEKIEVSTTARGVQVRVINRKGERRIDGTDLYFRMPEQASVEAEAVSSDITLSGSRGDYLTLRTVSGDVEVDASPQRVELNSVSGDVEYEGSSARSSFETVSGEIVIVGVSGEVTASTVSGDVSLDAGEVSRGRFEAVSGDLVLALSLADQGRLTCDSMSGDVKLELPASQQAEFTAQTFSGDIRTDFGKSARISKGPGVVLEHREGDNGARIRIETFSGDVSLRSH